MARRRREKKLKKKDPPKNKKLVETLKNAKGIAIPAAMKWPTAPVKKRARLGIP